MTADSILAYLASLPKRERPHELRSDTAFLAAWRFLRVDYDFIQDVVNRHGLDRASMLDMEDPSHQHAVGNAWGHMVDFVVRRTK